MVDLARRFKFAIDPHARVENISVGQQQRVEILKALYRSADVLILDEPTAVLTPQEARLFEILDVLKNEGLDHLHQPQARRGARDLRPDHGHQAREEDRDGPPQGAPPRQGLARMMVGREVLLQVEEEAVEPGQPLLQVTDLSVRDEQGLDAVRSVSFDVRAGEIVALAGVDGNGQSRLIDAITGLRRPTEGRVQIAGTDSGSQGRARDPRCGKRTFRDRHLPRSRPRLHTSGESRAARLPRGPASKLQVALPGSG